MSNGTHTYFAYGSNMFSPRLRYRVHGCEVIGPATLSGHRLRFHKRSDKDGSAKCNAELTSNPDDLVVGVLYRIPADELGELHKAEGRGYGYDDVLVAVVGPDGETHQAITYRANQSHIDDGLTPLGWYWDFVAKGAEEHQLPADYVEGFIRAVSFDADPDREQDRRERVKVLGEPHDYGFTTSPPSASEWQFASEMPSERQARPMEGRSFEDIASDIVRRCTVIGVELRPYSTSRVDRDARQIVFRIGLGDTALCDAFFNAPDGLRGRYWQSPYAGDAATRHFIEAWTPGLLEFFAASPPSVPPKVTSMTSEDVAVSLGCPSAKVWPYERDAQGQIDLTEGGAFLDVVKWRAAVNRNWRWTPEGRDLEIKGALIKPDRSERVPVGKRMRAHDIHANGFV